MSDRMKYSGWPPPKQAEPPTEKPESPAEEQPRGRKRKDNTDVQT